MKNFAMLFAAMMMAAAMMLGGQPASAASVSGVTPPIEAAANSNTELVRQWHQAGPSRFHKRWRSHHRRGSNYFHQRWRSHHRYGSRRGGW